MQNKEKKKLKKNIKIIIKNSKREESKEKKLQYNHGTPGRQVS
jgi:hypothetical protein